MLRHVSDDNPFHVARPEQDLREALARPTWHPVVMAAPPILSAAGIRFSAFGFPVTVSWFHFALPAFWLSGIDFARLNDGVSAIGVVAAYVGAVLVGVLGHELGHAFAARSVGAKAEIQLVLFGGLTTWSTGREITAPQRLRVSLAGPLTGMAIGAVAWLITNNVPVFRVELALFLELLTFVAFIWGVLNLIPFPGFDGGHSLDAALQIWKPDKALRWGAIIKGVASLLGIAFVAVRFGALSALIIALFVFRGGNPLQEYRQSQDGDRSARLDQALEQLLQGRLEESLALVKAAADGAQSRIVRQRASELLTPLLYWTGRWDELVEQDPGALPGSTRGVALMRLGRLTDAEVALRTATSDDRRNALLAETLARQDVAIADDADLTGMETRLLAQQARALAGTDRTVARRLAEAALQRSGLDAANQAVALIAAGRLEAALDVARGLDPAAGWPIETLAVAERGESVTDLLAMASDPAAVASVQGLLHDFGHFDLAVSAGRRAAELGNRASSVGFTMARSAVRAGDLVTGIESLTAAIGSGIDPQLAIASEDLAALRGSEGFAKALASAGPIESR